MMTALSVTGLYLAVKMAISARSKRNKLLKEHGLKETSDMKYSLSEFFEKMNKDLIKKARNAVEVLKKDLRKAKAAANSIRKVRAPLQTASPSTTSL